MPRSNNFDKNFLEALKKVYDKNKVDTIYRAYRKLIHGQSPKSFIQQNMEGNPRGQRALRDLWDSCLPTIFVKADEPHEFFHQAIKKAENFSEQTRSVFSKSELF